MNLKFKVKSRADYKNAIKIGKMAEQLRRRLQ